MKFVIGYDQLNREIAIEVVRSNDGKFDHDCNKLRKSDFQEWTFFCDVCHATWITTEKVGVKK